MLSEKEKEEIFTMWNAHSPLNKELQNERIDQVVYVVKKESMVMGVSTVYKQPFQGKLYYFLRTFIHPDIRGKMGMGTPDILRATNQRMQELNEQQREVEGMVVITENLKLKRPGVRKLFRDGGWKLVKLQRAKNKDVWFYPYPSNG